MGSCGGCAISKNVVGQAWLSMKLSAQDAQKEVVGVRLSRRKEDGITDYQARLPDGKT